MKSRIMLVVGLLVALFVLVLIFPPTFPTAQATSTTNVAQNVAFDQRLGEQVSSELSFVDEQAQPVKLGDYFHVKPMVLTLNYFSCPNLCSLELDQLTGTIADISLNLGEDYDIISVSIDPRDTSNIASQKKWQYIRRYARPGRGAGWHFLTGDKSAIEALTQAVGFRYDYDAENDEFAHPIGLIVLTPEGKIARYLYGVDYAANDLRLALVEASQNKIGTAIDQILLLCYHYDPSTGKYSPMVLNIVRLSGGIMVLAIAGGLGWLWKTDLKRLSS